MRAPSKLRLLNIFFFIAVIFLVVIIATHKTNPAVHVTTNATTNTLSRYVNEMERQNEIEHDQQEQAHKMAKLIKAKHDSVECQFWMQQKQNKIPPPNLEDKLTEFCELPPEQTAASPQKAL